MFNFFKKKKKEKEEDEIQSALTFYVKQDGEIFVDVNLVDYKEETLNNFAKVIAGISSLRFQLSTIDMIKAGFVECNKSKEFEHLLTQVVVASREDLESMEQYNNGREKRIDPCIKPSDML